MLQPNDFVAPDLTAWELMLRPCRTREELQQWLIIFLGIDPPDAIVDPESTCTPLEMAWMVYSNCLWWNDLPPEKRHRKMLFYASRFSFKTLIMAAVEFMVAIHDHRGVAHFASTMEQAQKCYSDYFQTLFLNRPFFASIRNNLTEATARKCKFEDGTKIICLPVTRRAVQSQHESLLCRDEIDVVQDIKAYYDLDGVPISMPDKRPAIDVGISVRKSAFGLVQREIEAAAEGVRQMFVGHWNIIDVTERCPDSRSGTKPVTLYVREGSMHVVDQDGFNKLDGGDKLIYHPTNGLSSTPEEEALAKTEKRAAPGCFSNCKLFAACLTNLKRQESKSVWLKTIADTEAQLLKTEETTFIASFLSRKPPSDGLVYTRFDQKNIKTYREMYQIFSGEEWPLESMSLDDFIGVMKKHGIPAVAGCDWGFNDPAVCLVAYIDRSDNVYVVYTLTRKGVDDPDFIRMIAQDIQPRFDVQRYFPDTGSPSNLKVMISTWDLPVSKSVDKSKGSVYDGVQVVKRFVTVPGTNRAKLFVSRENGGGFVINEFSKYHHAQDAAGRIDDTKFAEKDNDHSMDALRYMLATIYGRTTVTMTVASSEQDKPKAPDGTPIAEMPTKDMNGGFTKIPSALELAAHLGIPGFRDNRQEIADRKQAEEEAKNPTPGSKKDDRSGGSQGGFSWSM
jgi:hypothetical protein